MAADHPHEEEFVFDEPPAARDEEAKAQRAQDAAMRKALAQDAKRQERDQKDEAKRQEKAQIDKSKVDRELERQRLATELAAMIQSPLAGQYLGQRIHGFQKICERLPKMKLEELQQTKILFDSSLGAVSTGILSTRVLQIGTALIERGAGLIKPGILDGYSQECAQDPEIQLLFEVVALKRFNVSLLTPEQKLMLCLGQRAVTKAAQNASSARPPQAPVPSPSMDEADEAPSGPELDEAPSMRRG